MKYPHIRIGLCAVLLCMAVPVFAQTPPTLYERMRSVTRMEFARNPGGETQTDPAVRRFVSAVYAAEQVTPQNVDDAMARDIPAFCSDKEKDAFYCERLMQDVRNLAERELRIRTLGRDLQIIASSYELPVTADTDRTNMPIRAQAITRMWKAGTGTGSIHAGSGMILRILPFPKQTEPHVEQLYNSVQALRDAPYSYDNDLTAFRAAGWRYHYGARFIRGEFAPDAPPPVEPPSATGSELQYLSLRWPDIESAFVNIYANLPNTFTPPLQKNEIVVYQLTSDVRILNDLSAKALFDNLNLSVWSYAERKPGAAAISGDVGFAWQMPLEPVLPALCADDGSGQGETCRPVLAGFYPAEPTDGHGLCLQPLARKGYMCRPLSSADQQDVCKEDIKKTATINLATCTTDAVPRETDSGPNVCQDIQWVSSRTFDPKTQCKPKLICTAQPVPNGTFPAIKLPDGTLNISVQNISPLPTEYQMAKQLTIAEHVCGLPSGSNPYTGTAEQKNATCCRIEADGYRKACEAMQQDGIFGPESALESVPLLSGVGLNAVTCADILTDASCRAQGFGRCVHIFTQEQSDADIAALKVSVETIATNRWKILNPNIIIGSCSSTLTKLETASGSTRIKASRNALSMVGTEVCNPLARTQYENTIGNNLCYLGSCVEQSLERHRLTPGRQSFETNETIYPWDACRAPLTAGSITTSASNLPTQVPVYRPELLMQELDRALCQASGLPISSPPSVCMFNTSRRLLIPIQHPLEQALALAQEGHAETNIAANIELLSEAVASRMGSTLYAEALERGSRALSAVTINAAELLEQLARVSFSRVMCPLNDGDGAELIATPFCAALPQ